MLSRAVRVAVALDVRGAVRRIAPQLALTALVTILALVVVEILLRVFLPFQLATIGHGASENARLYGWGLPHEAIRIRDPDDGTVFLEQVNAQRRLLQSQHIGDNP